MSSFIHKTPFFCLAGILMIFASCGESFGIDNVFETFGLEIGHNGASPNEQELLMEAINCRLHVSDIVFSNGICSVSFFGNKTARIRCDCFPLIVADNNNNWLLNGKVTGQPVLLDEEGGVILPMLAPGKEYWSFDNIETDLLTQPYWGFDEQSHSIHIVGILEYKERLYIYLSDSSIATLSIVKESFYRVPDYWMEHLVEKEKMAETAIADAEGDCATFVFFTDAHWGKNMRKSPALIRHIVDYSPVKDVLFGGDVITTHSTNKVDPIVLGLDFQDSFSFLGTRFHCIYGNHDNNSDSQPGKFELHLSEEQVYYWLQSQMADVVYGNYYNFYYDNPEKRTRIICLDTGRYYYPLFRDNLPKTVHFAIESLQSLPEGWHVIMASHIWCSSQKKADGTYRQYLDKYIKSILKVFDDYNARSDGQYIYNNQSLSYDFSQSDGHIEFCIGGHTHGDFTTSSDGGIPVIIVTSDYVKKPQTNTIKEQSVTLVVTDYKNNIIHLFAVGRGEDRHIIL